MLPAPMMPIFMSAPPSRVVPWPPGPAGAASGPSMSVRWPHPGQPPTGAADSRDGAGRVVCACPHSCAPTAAGAVAVRGVPTSCDPVRRLTERTRAVAVRRRAVHPGQSGRRTVGRERRRMAQRSWQVRTAGRGPRYQGQLDPLVHSARHVRLGAVLRHRGSGATCHGPEPPGGRRNRLRHDRTPCGAGPPGRATARRRSTRNGCVGWRASRSLQLPGALNPDRVERLTLHPGGDR